MRDLPCSSYCIVGVPFGQCHCLQLSAALRLQTRSVRWAVHPVFTCDVGRRSRSTNERVSLRREGDALLVRSSFTNEFHRSCRAKHIELRGHRLLSHSTAVRSKLLDLFVQLLVRTLDVRRAISFIQSPRAGDGHYCGDIHRPISSSHGSLERLTVQDERV